MNSNHFKSTVTSPDSSSTNLFPSLAGNVGYTKFNTLLLQTGKVNQSGHTILLWPSN